MTDTPKDITSTEPMRVLFLCTHNSSRSQMAEGLLHARGGQRFRVFSAGTHPRIVYPLAVRAMAELGIDISERAGHRAKGMEEFANEPPMDLVITVFDEAAEECPYFPNARQQRHWSFPDPSVAGQDDPAEVSAGCCTPPSWQLLTVSATRSPAGSCCG